MEVKSIVQVTIALLASGCGQVPSLTPPAAVDPSGAAAASAPLVPAFVGTVTSVEILGASQTPAKIELIEPLPRHLVTVRVDAHPPDGRGPFEPGTCVAFAINSPSRTFGRPGEAAVGNRFLFRMGAERLNQKLSASALGAGGGER